MRRAIGDDELETEKVITGEEFFLPGHFPGVSIFPGAMMQELTTQSAGILIAARFNPMETYNTHDPAFNPYALGVLARVKGSRYSGFARPGDTLRTHVKLNEIVGNLFDFSATIRVGDRVIMRNAFRLTNVPTSVLFGEQAVSAD